MIHCNVALSSNGLLFTKESWNVCFLSVVLNFTIGIVKSEVYAGFQMFFQIEIFVYSRVCLIALVFFQEQIHIVTNNFSALLCLASLVNVVIDIVCILQVKISTTMNMLP